MKIIANGKRYDTDRLEELISRQRNQGHATGVTLVGAWKTRSGNVLVVTDSVWESSHRDGTTVGVTAHIADSTEVAGLAERYGGEIEQFVPEG